MEKLLKQLEEIAKGCGLRGRTNGDTNLEGADNEKYFESVTARSHSKGLTLRG
jgi:hypothetical protein